MEAMRMRLMVAENALAAIPPNRSVISVSSSSTSSSDAPRPTMAPRAPRLIVELSDSDNDDDSEDEVKIIPLDPRPAVAVPVQAAQYSTPQPLPPPRPHKVQRNYQSYDLNPDDNTSDPVLTAADTEKALRDLVAGAYGHDDMDVSIEDAEVDGFREGVKLLPHQITSRKWMADRESGKKTGGILADDMGLGKTIQTITRIVEGRAHRKDKEEGWSPATLVICPVAVVSQWASEIKKIAVGLKVIEHHGPNRTSDPYELENVHVVITSYPTVASEYATYISDAKDESKKPKKMQANENSDERDESGVGRASARKRAVKKAKDSLFRVHWWRVVLDEAHNIKNRNTKAALACCALEAKYRWCLTGTPMQNSVDEIYSLLRFLRIRPLNDWHTFNEQITKPVKANRPRMAIKRLHVVLGSLMLRRTKDTLINGRPIVELPKRIVQIVDCLFDAEERAFYESVEGRVQESLEKLERQGGAGRAYTSMLVLLLRLRQACNHPSLVSQDYGKDRDAVEPKAAKSQDDDADDLADRLAGMGINKRCQLCQVELDADNIGVDGACTDCSSLVAKARRSTLDTGSNLPPDSAKVRKILEILEEIDERSESKEKTIIFSQFTSMLNIIEPFLRARGIKFVRYDGSMDKRERDWVLDKIKESKSTRVILISFKAGSTGLNLTCCNNVVLVDLWWNPALEDQAFDRAHRFGQQRDVYIHKLCVPDTVEQRILELQTKKKELAKAALSGDRVKNMRLAIDELVALFRPGSHEDD